MSFYLSLSSIPPRWHRSQKMSVFVSDVIYLHWLFVAKCWAFISLGEGRPYHHPRVTESWGEYSEYSWATKSFHNCVLMFEVFSCLVLECKAFSPDVTLNNELLARLKVAEMFGGVRTTSLRCGAPASCDSEHVSASMRRQAREKGGKCFSINFFCVYPVHGWWRRSACLHILCGLGTCVLLCKVDILFARVWKHFMSVFLWGAGVSLDSLDFSGDSSNNTVLHTGGAIHLFQISFVDFLDSEYSMRYKIVYKFLIPVGWLDIFMCGIK